MRLLYLCEAYLDRLLLDADSGTERVVVVRIAVVENLLFILIIIEQLTSFWLSLAIDLGSKILGTTTCIFLLLLSISFYVFNFRLIGLVLRVGYLMIFCD